MKQRIDQILSRFGYCSRREARAWVRDGRVRMEDGPVLQRADGKADPGILLVDGAPIPHPTGFLLLLNKPAGLVCSHSFDEGDRVYDLLPESWMRRTPVPSTVGRLDRDTTGALLVTDLPNLLHRLSSPRHEVEKVYLATTDLPADPSVPPLFASGTLRLKGETTPLLPAACRILGPNEWELTLREGRYHQVKRMFAAVGLQVTRLHRSRFGPWTVENMEPGTWRVLPTDNLP